MEKNMTMLDKRLSELDGIFNIKQLEIIKEIFTLMESKYPAYSKEDIISICIETILKHQDKTEDALREKISENIKKDLHCFTEELESLDFVGRNLEYFDELDPNRISRKVTKEIAKVMADSKEEYERNVFVMTCYISGMPLTMIAKRSNLSIYEVEDIINDEVLLASVRAMIGTMLVENNGTNFNTLGKAYSKEAIDTYINLNTIEKAVYGNHPKKIC